MFDGSDNISTRRLIIKSPVEIQNIDIIPSDLSLSVLSEYLTTKTNRENLFGDGLKIMSKSKDYITYLLIYLLLMI